MRKGWILIAVLAVGCQSHEPGPTRIPPGPPGPATGPIGIRACDDYLHRIAACTALTPAARQAFATNAGAWQQAATSPDTAKAADESCQAATTAAEAQLHELGC
jgi:hypothetical protein